MALSIHKCSVGTGNLVNFIDPLGRLLICVSHGQPCISREFGSRELLEVVAGIFLKGQQ
jgi:hypothetical protein